jgi:hypothetical protein
LDLNFGVPREIYYRASTYTANNLFNTYYSKFINEITDKDSKIVTAYFHLTPLDILTLDFRNEFYFDNQRFRLNKIYDYNPIVNELTKCEFVKLKEANRYSGLIGLPVNGAGLSSGDIQLLPSFGDDVLNAQGNNTPNTPIGNDNTYGNGGRNVLVNGGNNYVHDYVDGVTLLNSSGDTVYAGLRNVTLINTNDVEITSGDVVAINGVVYPKIFNQYSTVLNVPSSTKTYNLGVVGGLLLVETGATNTAINLPSASSIYVYDNTYGYAFGKIINIKKVDNGIGNVVINPNGSETIDGQLTQTLYTQYDNISIQSDGTNWHII